MENTVARPPLADLRIVGGNLALDFVNTRSGPRDGPVDAEWLSSYEDFAAWSRRVAGPGPARPDPAASPRPAAMDAVAAFARVVACRDDLDEIFRPLADGRAPLDTAVRRLQLAYVEALAHGRLAGGPPGYAWTWEPGRDLLAPLWPVVAAAVELLTASPARPAIPVKACSACRFLFIDQSKNGSRRWCSMDDCGKAAKIARYLQRRSDASALSRPGG
jgi:predicted RNA-binding Zn ribbon-like protein